MRLRDLQSTDSDRMLEWMHDETIARNFRFNAANTQMKQVCEFILKASNDSHFLHQAITDDENRYMGTISLKNIDTENRKAEYAIVLHPEAIGKGYAKFATEQILKIAFEQYQLNRVYFNVLSDNERAIRFYEKMGFQFEGEFRQDLILNGEPHDLKWYRMLKDEYDKREGILMR